MWEVLVMYNVGEAASNAPCSIAQNTIIKHPRPLVTVDNVIISKEDDSCSILLIQRLNEPFSSCWALPGGFIHENESPDNAVQRKLYSETSLQSIPLFPFGVFAEPFRDPRGWVISLGYCALVKKSEVMPHARDDAEDAKWFQLQWQICDDCITISLNYNDCFLGAKLRELDEKTSLGHNCHFDILKNTGIAFDHAKIVASAIQIMEKLVL